MRTFITPATPTITLLNLLYGNALQWGEVCCTSHHLSVLLCTHVSVKSFQTTNCSLANMHE